MGLGAALMYAGEWERSIAASEQAARLSPHDPTFWLFLTVKALSLIGQGRYREAAELQRQATRQPTAAWTAHLAHASALGFLGETTGAREALDRIRRIKPDFTIDDVREIMVYRDPVHLEQLVESLRVAGLEV